MTGDAARTARELEECSSLDQGAVDTRVVASLLDRRVQFVCGKGGVGRTVVACALALRASRQGHRTLLLEVGADAAASCLAVDKAVDTPREVLNNLWLCRMTPQGSLHEYALMVLKFKALYALVFENKLVKYLLRSTPSLAELTMLGKTWYHTEEKREEELPRFDRLIVDSPATGHAITFLSVGRTVANIAPAGIMKDAAEKMAQMVESHEDTCMHVVCLPQEMPVNEAIDLAGAAKRKLRMALGLGIVNRVLPPFLSEEEQRILTGLDLVANPLLSPYCEAAKRRVDREQWQRDLVGRFEQESDLPCLRIPDFGVSPDLSEVIKVFAEGANDEVQDGQMSRRTGGPGGTEVQDGQMSRRTGGPGETEVQGEVEDV